MDVRNSADLGLALRRSREKRGWSQAELARRIGASRHWVLAAEKGKPSAEMGLVLKALAALGLAVEVSDPASASLAANDASRGGSRTGSSTSRAPGAAFIPDLSDVLAMNTGARNILVPYAGSDGRLRRDSASGEGANGR